MTKPQNKCFKSFPCFQYNNALQPKIWFLIPPLYARIAMRGTRQNMEWGGGESLHSFVSLVTIPLPQVVFPIFCFSFNWKTKFADNMCNWSRIIIVEQGGSDPLFHTGYSIDLSARPIVMVHWWGREIANPNASLTFNSHVNSLYLSCNTLTCFFSSKIKTINYHVNILVTTDVSGCKWL